MSFPTAGLAFDRPTRYVMPLIRAGMLEADREGRPRAEAPEIAVLSDCFKQFEHQGLQRLVMDLACTAAEATTMLAEISPLSRLEILNEFATNHAIDMALDSSLKPGDVVWGYIPAMLRSLLAPGTSPTPDEVLFEIDEKHGFSASMEFLIALAYYTGATMHRIATETRRAPDDVALLLEDRTKAAWANLDTYDTNDYANP